MKNFIPVFFCFLVVISCGPKDKNISLVKKEFKSYVQKTFDDPKSMKEIVEIVASDTLSLDFMRRLSDLSIEGVAQSRKLFNMKDSLHTKELEEIYNDLKKNFKGSYADAFTAQLKVAEILSCATKIPDAKIKMIQNQIQMEGMRDSLTYHPAIYVYDIKYRNEYSSGLKLESAYAYIDSLSGFKGIFPDKCDTDVMCEEYVDIFEQSKKCLNSVNNTQELYNNYDEKVADFKDFIIRYSTTR